MTDTGVPPARTVRHGDLGFSLDLPAGASMAVELPPVITLGDLGQWGFRPVVVVSAEELAVEVAVADWVDAALGVQASNLEGAGLIDRQHAVVAGHPAVRTLVHHRHGDHAVALEQWWMILNGRGWVVAASCAALDYDHVADGFARLAASFAPDGTRPTPGSAT